MTLRVVPEGLAAASAAVEALTARLAAAHAAAAPVITSVVPPAADPVSLQTGIGFSALGNEHVAVAAEAVEELGVLESVWANPASVMRPVMLRRPRLIWVLAAWHDGTGVDGRAAAGAVGVAQRPSGILPRCWRPRVRMAGPPIIGRPCLWSRVVFDTGCS